MIGLINKIADSKVGFRVFISLALLFLVGSPIFFGLWSSWYDAWQWTLIELIVCGCVLVAGVLGMGIPWLTAWLIATTKHREITQKDLESGIAVMMGLVALSMVGLCIYAYEVLL